MKGNPDYFVSTFAFENATMPIFKKLLSNDFVVPHEVDFGNLENGSWLGFFLVFTVSRLLLNIEVQ